MKQENPTDFEFGQQLGVKTTPIPGVVLLTLPVHGDNRGWFKENWQREKMMALGLPDFAPVQNNMSFNELAGTTRGIHAEPWDKYISVAVGKVFGAWVDLREGPSFGSVFTTVLDPATAIYVPAGVGNAFQTLCDGTLYSYLVNRHWSADEQRNYTFVNLADPALAIEWPIDLEDAELSAMDKEHPALESVKPTSAKRTLVLGGNGQVGLALREHFKANPLVDFATRNEADLSDPASFAAFDFSRYETVINAAAMTAVDHAETPQGRQLAWAVNASAVAQLASICTEHRVTLVQLSSDYVFDGRKQLHAEDEALSPLGVYGQSKAAGELAALGTAKHYVVRTSWVIGEGKNFIATMASLAKRGISPHVVDDQFGRLSFAADIAAAIDHLLTSNAHYGIYNMSNSGPSQSWAEIAADVFELLGRDRASVTGVSTEAYFAGKDASPRPQHSTLNLEKLSASGFHIQSARKRLGEYLACFA